MGYVSRKVGALLPMVLTKPWVPSVKLGKLMVQNRTANPKEVKEGEWFINNDIFVLIVGGSAAL